MFNRRLMFFVVLLVFTFGVLWWNWQGPEGESLQTGQGVISSTRYIQALNGSWDQFSSLRQAWTTESDRAQGKNNQSFLTGGRPLTLPSSKRFMVGAKRFRVPGEWSSRTMLLTFNGVQGHADVYLNGVASDQKVGEFEGSGGADGLEIPAKVFRYGEDNILVIEFSGSAEQRTTLFGSAWPNSGLITGEIRLEAVVETIFLPPQVDVSWNETTAQVTVKTSLQHHDFSQDGSWTVYGVFSDGSAGVAEQTQTVSAQKNADLQPVTLTFTVPNARRWTMQDPFLYQLHLTVTNSRGDLDDLTLPLGLRTLALSAGKWLLNNQAVPIKGVALTLQEEYQLRHAGQLGPWLTSERQKGTTLVYFIGQIPDELWLQAADRAGMGLWAELPVEMIPSDRLPQPDLFRKIVAQKMLHPSLWAWTVGKGLAEDALAQTYLQQSAKVVQPDLAFAFTFKNTSAVLTGLSADQSLYAQGNKIQGTWGQVTVETPPTVGARWAQEAIVAGIWAILMIFLAWMNIWSVTWRYKEIGEKRPRRRLRCAWRWDGLFLFARQGLLAGLVTSGLFRIPIHFSPWFAHLWPGIELLQGQSPWRIWAMLSVLFMLVRLFLVGLVAPHLPDAPPALGLLYWLERRYRWAVFIAIGWALFPWGVPFYVPTLGYIFLVFLFLPIRIRDIHRVGGHYRLFLLVPGIVTCVLLGWVSFHFADWVYLWHLLRP